MFDFLKRLWGRPPSPLAPRLRAAQRMYDVSRKDAALRELVRDAAAGDVGMVRLALDAMYDVGARSTAGYDAALQLARAGDGAGAIATAQRIYDTGLRDEALAKIGQGAKAAVPALVDALKDRESFPINWRSSKTVSSRAAGALSRIDPEAARRAGVP